MSEDVRVYTDDVNKFKIEIPQGEIELQFTSLELKLCIQLSCLNSMHVHCVFMWLGSEWQVGTGEPNGFKSITAFYPQEASNSNGILEVHLYF